MKLTVWASSLTVTIPVQRGQPQLGSSTGPPDWSRARFHSATTEAQLRIEAITICEVVNGRLPGEHSETIWSSRGSSACRAETTVGTPK